MPRIRLCDGSRPVPLPPFLVPAALAVGMLALLTGCADEEGTPTTPAPVPVPPAPDPPPAGVPTDVAAWVNENAIPFEGTSISLPHDDIRFLRGLVGDARIVALGENTHGTRDFFEMKARILRFLVEEMGFNTFAIEATWPESRLMDDYVRTGEGDGARLLDGLYFWTWRTESVLEMIEWMRSHNDAGGDVGFHGFDMQYPGRALANVIAYVRSVDESEASRFQVLLECLDRYANDPDTGRFPEERYRDQTDEYRVACGDSLEEARELLLAARGDYEAASGPGAFEVALRSFRVAFQYHLMVTGEQGRDESMAENTEWIARQIGPTGRMVLWAHNYHVSTLPYAQGSYLRETFGDDLLILGFTHERGTLTGIRHDTSANRYYGLSEMDLDDPVNQSVEHYLSSSQEPRFLLDLRGVTRSTPGGSFLAGNRLTRSIGCCYDPENRSAYWSGQDIAGIFDLLIHFRSTGPTTVLPSFR